MQSMIAIARGSGACPQGNLKVDALRLHFKALSMDLQSLNSVLKDFTVATYMHAYRLRLMQYNSLDNSYIIKQKVAKTLM